MCAGTSAHSKWSGFGIPSDGLEGRYKYGRAREDAELQKYTRLMRDP